MHTEKKCPTDFLVDLDILIISSEWTNNQDEGKQGKVFFYREPDSTLFYFKITHKETCTIWIMEKNKCLKYLSQYPKASFQLNSCQLYHKTSKKDKKVYTSIQVYDKNPMKHHWVIQSSSQPIQLMFE